MTRNGKIARLSFELREELNERILNGEPGNILLEWLNDQDEVFEMLEEHFAGVPISDQNLSEWKAGGYQAWLANREARETVLMLARQSGDLGEASEEANMGQCLANLLMVEFIKLARVLVQKEEDPQKRWKQLREVNRELCRLRKTNMRQEQLGIRRQRCDWEVEDRERAEEEKHAAWVKKQRLAPYKLPLSVAILAHGAEAEDKEAAWNAAAHRVEIENDLPFGFLQKDKGDGYWRWEEDEEQWFWWRTGETPKAEVKKEASAQNEEDGMVESRETSVEDQKSAPADPAGRDGCGKGGGDAACESAATNGEKQSQGSKESRLTGGPETPSSGAGSN